MEIGSGDHLVFYLQLASCAVMTGVIWIVQLILYPTFSLIEKDRFKQFHEMHSSRITLIVGPAMLIELVTAIALVRYHRMEPFWWLNLAFIILLWISTAFLSLPIHNKLADGFDLIKIKKLILTNWPRTFLWTLRLVILILFSEQLSAQSL